ncbi:saccharopine dehydrogenase family protein [Agromyces binzhouensis]|uniref:saccharopine dehydrogenase family protein n=1 Tax=Agromyces binzhouensis TaxID=1817495 RepID=UPI0036322CC7
MSSRLLIYGAYGYTGDLIARSAVARGWSPIVAGRNAARVESLARELGVEGRSFDLSAAQEHLEGVDVVLHCAGPFSATAAPMMAACLSTGTHYLDITGEMDVFEHADSLTQEASEAGVVLCPGVGFDVVPTDCLAARLAEELPDATRLSLAILGPPSLSPGTVKTLIEGMAVSARRRVGGVIEAVEFGSDIRMIDFGDGPTQSANATVADLSSAFRSTGIGNITTYAAVSDAQVRQFRMLHGIRRLIRFAPVSRLLKKLAAPAHGPDAAERAAQPGAVWGEVENAAGETRVGRIRLANSYTLTVDSSLGLAQHLLEQAPAEGGTCTPSQLVGWQFVEGLPGSEPIAVSVLQR